MQPSRAFSLRLDSTTSALHRTKVPWCCRVLGCAETSTQNTWAPTPTCGAARPTQPGETRIVATRSAARRTTSSAVGSTRSPTDASTSAGARDHVEHPAVDAELGLGPGEHGRVGGHRSSASASRSVAPTPSARGRRVDGAAERLDVGAGGQVDLGDEQVEVAGQPGGEVGDVAADRGHLADHGGDDAGAVAAVDGEHPRAAGGLVRRLDRAPRGRVTVSVPSSASGASAASISAPGASPSQTSVIAKWPRSRVIVESSRLRPRPASRPVVSAMIPGRSWPRTVMAWRVTGAFSQAGQRQRAGPAEDLVQHVRA